MAARTALVAGAVGRAGEALLNRVLGSGDYAMVVAAAEAPMALGVHRLLLSSPDRLPPLDDAFVLLSDPDDEGSRSYYGRDAPFVQVHEGNCLQVARQAVAAGAKRLVLVVPTPAWQQVGHFHRGLGNATELAISQLPLDSLVILRPASQSARRGGNLLARLASVYISLQLLMLPKSVDVLTSEKLARCALAAMRHAHGGVEVIGADRLGALAA
jgi:hypothetical protein